MGGYGGVSPNQIKMQLHTHYTLSNALAQMLLFQGVCQGISKSFRLI